MPSQLITKWGNSLAIRIPKPLADQAHLREGVGVEITVLEGKLVIELERKEYSLDELLAGVTETNLHAEIDPGSAVGREVW
jgi:antitoxin MazE